MSVFNSLPPKINKINLIKWLKQNYSFLSNKSIKLNRLNSERDKNYILQINAKQK